MKHLLLVVAMLAPASSMAAETAAIPHNHELPATLPMFERIVLARAIGKAKGHGCGSALAAAYTDLERTMKKHQMTNVVAVFPLNRSDRWLAVDTVNCVDNGKKQVVKLEALLTKAGTGAAFKPITGTRALEILALMQGTGESMTRTQIMKMRLLDHHGRLYYDGGTHGYSDTVFAGNDNRNTRAATMFREVLLPAMSRLGRLLGAVPEFKGTEIIGTATRINKYGDEVSEAFTFRVGTAAVQQFFHAQITGQQLVDAGTVLYSSTASSSSKLRMTVSFSDSD